MELEKLEKFYKVHSRIYNLTRPFFLLGRKRFFKQVHLKKSDKVLDLACGTGINFGYILKYIPAKNLTAIDYSNSMLSVARKNYPEVKIIRGDVSKYEFKTKYDKIICTYSLSMIDNWQATIVNISKHLKKEGELLILDFHPWRRFKIIYGLFRKSLEKKGVYPDKDYGAQLKKFFKHIHKKTSTLNYYAIYRASD